MLFSYMSSWVNWKTFVTVSALYIDYSSMNCSSVASVGLVLEGKGVKGS